MTINARLRIGKQLFARFDIDLRKKVSVRSLESDPKIVVGQIKLQLAPVCLQILCRSLRSAASSRFGALSFSIHSIMT